jgi:hypothetical protein
MNEYCICQECKKLTVVGREGCDGYVKLDKTNCDHCKRVLVIDHHAFMQSDILTELDNKLSGILQKCMHKQ